MDTFIAQEQRRNRNLTATRQHDDRVTVALSGPQGTPPACIELSAEQARQLGGFLAPADDIAVVVRALARAMHRYESTDEVDLVGEDTCDEAAALRAAVRGLIDLVDPRQRALWRQQDTAQWRADYPHYAAKLKAPA